MKQRLFFIFLFIIGLLIGAFYFTDFLSNQHPTFGNKITTKLWLFIALAIFIQLLAHVLRAYKSRLLIKGIRPAPTKVLFKGLSVGFLFNTLLPLRLGEIIRAYYVGDSLAISKTAVFISIIIERLLDGFILGLCFISAGLIIRNTSQVAFTHLWHIGLGLVVVSTILGILIYAIRSERKIILESIHSFTSLFNTRLADRSRFIAWSGIYGTKLMLRNKKIVSRYILLSLGMWVLYFGSTILIALAYFQSINTGKAWFIAQTTYAGVSAPAGPGYIGTFHIIVSRLLNDIGLSATGGFALIIWLVLVLPISLIGLFVLVRQKFIHKRPINKEQMLINKLHRGHNISGELSHFLEAYFKGEKINQILTQAELDNRFRLIKSLRGGSNAHTMLVWQDNVKKVKKIALPQYADKLEAQANWLSERAGLKHLPTVAGQEKTEHHYYFDLEYREEFYPFFDYIHSHSPEKSFKILSKVIDFMDKSIYKPMNDKAHHQKVLDYIDGKVIQKAADTASMSNSINKLMIHKKLKINGVSYHNLAPVVEKIKRHKKIMKHLASYNESPIHGDLTIDNLIVNDKEDFLLLDPNDENQVSAKVVDLGKLYQSLHSGYEFLIQLDHCTVKGQHINFKDSKSHRYAELFRLLDQKLKTELKPEEYSAILFHEAVHYCRMLTYRVNINPRTVPVFYATAVKLFNEFLEQYA